MCDFFSCISNGQGKIYYFDYEMRQKIIKGETTFYTDSHSSIAEHYKLNDDKVNKYEYNPLTKVFRIDQLNIKDDSRSVKIQCIGIDFKKLCPELIIKKIIYPFNKRAGKVTQKDITNLKKWDSVRDSVGDSVWASVWASVGASVGDSVRDSVWDSVRASVWDSVRASVWASVGDSVRDSVWDSVRDSVRAYMSSFFNLDEWKYIKHKKRSNPFQPCIDLWERGLVPSFDGKTWRLHKGKNAKICYEWKPRNKK